MKKLLPPTYWSVALIVMVALHFVLPIVQVIHGPWRWAGLIVILLGGVITIWADQIFKRVGTTVKPFERSSTLVTRGPFRISRHPMYLGMTLLLVGVAFLCGSLIAFVGPIVYAVLMQVLFIPEEEHAMEETFGEQYREYREHVRQWL